MTELEEGQKAPDFCSVNQDDKKICLKDLRGKKIVLYFYPEDDTSGCTTESCNFRDNYHYLQAQGYEVYGVSADSIKSHVKFRKKYNLPFDLLADENKELLNLYGVWGEKTLFGRTYMGIRRTTFIIDEKGFITRIIRKVDNANATQQIMEGANA